MNMLEPLVVSLQSVVIFRNLLKDEAIVHLSSVCGDLSDKQKISHYARFVAELFRGDGDLGKYLLKLVLEDENLYVQKLCKRLPVGWEMEQCLAHELGLFEELCSLKAQDVQACIGYDGYLPPYANSIIDFKAAYAQRMKSLSTLGYGIYANNSMFTLQETDIMAVQHPDRTLLSDLKGYEMERQAVVDNTLALINARPAANCLLYGDAGTGKSSTIKAIANSYKDQGLRLIQVQPSQFCHIPLLMQKLMDNPLKFILFIDDLSFAEQNDAFTSLKAILEGSVVQKAPNVAIYATSNRMHLVKELFSDRDADIHSSETVAELTSLSERFGLCIGFYKPDKAQYLEIVRQLKEQHGIGMNDIVLEAKAEQFALARGGRSPRAARQFIDSLLAHQL